MSPSGVVTNIEDQAQALEETRQTIARYVTQQNLDRIAAVDRQTRQLLQAIMNQLKPGLSESQAQFVASECFEAFGIPKKWHTSYLYFGPNTRLTYRDMPQTEHTLKQHDIAYLDIAPIIDGIEGDAGQTLVLGDDPVMLGLRDTSQRLFESAVDFWRSVRPTGIELYQWVFEQTQQAGYEFILEGPGHLVGAFPHQRWKGGLNTYPYPVESGVWILEIHIALPGSPYAAFYEGLIAP